MSRTPLEQGLIKSLDNKVLGYLPDYRKEIKDERMRSIAIRHMLTMASGIDEMRLSFDKALADPVAEILRQLICSGPCSGT